MEHIRLTYERRLSINNRKGVERYKRIAGSKKFDLIIDTEIEGVTITDLASWENHINKNEIIDTVHLFQQHLRNISFILLPSVHRLGTVGSPGPGINTPILQTGNDHYYNMTDFIFDFELAIHNNHSNYALSIVDENRAVKILDDFLYALDHSEFAVHADPLVKTEIGKYIFNNFTVDKNVQWISNCFNAAFEMHDKYPVCPKSLINTKLGRRILADLKAATYSDYVFSHNYLCYKSFVLNNQGKLIGIKNWQYAGWYPPELEQIIVKYIDEI